ncbi:hypothetical protein N7493_009385 [Penicillium malachiteum]|uniref:Uncharacterized protein n=1 Tax=Penicillium malachiteum TaxID=1324776 RepID=A0AAD6HF74_9EURO|nr:hypothetical protein N7493_009385 [Penicillium malachiteum]
MGVVRAPGPPTISGPHPPWSWMPDGLGQNGPCRAANWAPYLACHAVGVGPFLRSPAAAHRLAPTPQPTSQLVSPTSNLFQPPLPRLSSSFGWGWFFCRPSPSQLVPPTSNLFTKGQLVFPYLSLVFGGVSALPSDYGRTLSTGPALVPSGLPFHQRSFLLFLPPSPPFRQLADHSSPVDTRAGARRLNAPFQAPRRCRGPRWGGVKPNNPALSHNAQRLVATRLLDRVHDPLGHFSRLQRIYPSREVTLQSASQLPGVSPWGPSPAC